MKKFLYVEDGEGGAELHHLSQGNYPNFLFGWMEQDCEREDLALMEWMASGSTSVGTYHEHRLGVCIRLKDVT